MNPKELLVVAIPLGVAYLAGHYFSRQWDQEASKTTQHLVSLDHL